MIRVFVLVAVLVLASSMGAPEAPSWTGTLAVKGNEPFTYLALTDHAGHQWRLSGELAKALWNAQGRVVRVTGKPEGRDGIVVETWVWVPERQDK